MFFFFPLSLGVSDFPIFVIAFSLNTFFKFIIFIINAFVLKGIYVGLRTVNLKGSVWRYVRLQ